MKRRNFLKASSILPLGIGGFGIKNLSATPFLASLGLKAATNDKILVLIQLSGGNDGINTIIPLDQYTNLSKARSNVLITESEVLKLTGTTKTGLHPAMTEVRSMYDNGLVNIVQSAGYPKPNFSHFRSTDIWHSGSDSDENWETGWLGRALNEEFPGYPTGYPTQDMPDPLALGIGTFSTVTQGPTNQMGIGVSNPATVYNLINGNTDTPPNSNYGKELTYIRLVNDQTNVYTQAIKAANDKGKNLSTKYPTGGRNNSLGEQLKIVARLINGGLKTKVYMVSIGGFDTHATQVDASDHKVGAHANLLKTLSDSIGAFQDDIQLLGLDDRVAGMTYSEFGRRIMSNLSGGTDHGAAAPMITFGKNVQGGILGNSPVIPDTVQIKDNLPMQFDMRQVYASAIKDWFGITGTKLTNVMGGKSFDILPIFKGSNVSIKDFEDIVSNIKIYEPFPNPAGDEVNLKFKTDGGTITISVFDPLGNLVKIAFRGRVASGEIVKSFSLAGLSSGNYFIQLAQGNSRVSSVIIKN